MSATDALPTGLALGASHLPAVDKRYPLAAVAVLAVAYYVRGR